MDRSKIVAFSIALGFIIVALGVKWFINLEGPPKYRGENAPILMGPGSEHSHMSILVFVDGVALDFSLPEFQLQDDRVHFEDGDGTTIHKHAKGVSLAMFFRTLDMEISADCLTLRTKSQYCSDRKKSLKSYLNREPFVDWGNYELRPDDKILIDYGESSDMDIGLRLNAVPDLPEDL